MTRSTAQRPTIATLIYLFADRVVPRTGTLSRGTLVPCSEVEVRTDELATLLWASAFWNLREQSFVGLELFHRRRLISNQTQIRVIRMRQGHRPGLEGAILDLLGEEGTVLDVICRWFDGDFRAPWNVVVKQPVEEAIAGRFIDAPEVPHESAPDSPPDEGLRPKCGKIAGLRAEFDDFFSTWEEFRATEPMLHDHLVNQCARAIGTCTEKYYL